MILIMKATNDAHEKNIIFSNSLMFFPFENKGLTAITSVLDYGEVLREKFKKIGFNLQKEVYLKNFYFEN